MSLRDVALVLGPVRFAGFEIPESIAFGGRQLLAVHTLPGGGRVVDAIGPAPLDIAWSGIFGGPDAASRARLLDTLRAQGNLLTLAWDAYCYTVVIATFDARYHNTAWVPYRLTLTVVQDLSVSAPPPADDLAPDVIADAQEAAGLVSGTAVSLAGLQAAIAAPNATAAGTASALAARQAAGLAIASVGAASSAADQALGGYIQNGVVSATDVASMVQQAGQDATLTAAGFYLGRLATNLAATGA